MTTSDLFKKHFPESGGSVGIFHPNIEAFFDELNRVCIMEDKEKKKKKKAETAGKPA